MKKAINFLKQKSKNIAHSGEDYFSHCFNVFKILQSWNKEKHVCLAGLYHSIYDTESFEVKLNISRKEVVKQIGKKSEELCWKFCNLKNKEIYLLNVFPKEKELFFISYANMIEQKDRLNNTDIKDMIKRYQDKLL